MLTAVDHDRRDFVGRAAMTVATTRLGTVGTVLQQLACAAFPGAATGPLSALRSASAWLNSPALTADALRGKVVLVDFGTYTCINWLRTLPYVRAWNSQYRARGLVVIGVHTPEFSFEHDLENVRRALKELELGFPIAIDNDYAIWHGFENHYWPAVYVADAEGRIRFQHFGEGEYDRTEEAVRRLLGDGLRDGLAGASVSVSPRGIEVGADWGSLGTPETYIGYARGDRFASPGGIATDERRDYAAAARLERNEWSLAGGWTVGREAAVLHGGGGRIAFRFHARDLHLVMGPSTRDTPVRFRVRLENQAPGDAHGIDVDDDGRGTVTEQRLYQLVRQRGRIVDRVLEIEFLDPGVEAFAFTFG